MFAFLLTYVSLKLSFDTIITLHATVFPKTFVAVYIRYAEVVKISQHSTSELACKSARLLYQELLSRKSLAQEIRVLSCIQDSHSSLALVLAKSARAR